MLINIYMQISMAMVLMNLLAPWCLRAKVKGTGPDRVSWYAAYFLAFWTFLFMGGKGCMLEMTLLDFLICFHDWFHE